MYNVALCYELVGDIERAIKYYKLAIDNDNDHKEANHNLELLLGEKYVPENASLTKEVPEDWEETIQQENEKQDALYMLI